MSARQIPVGTCRQSRAAVWRMTREWILGSGLSLSCLQTAFRGILPRRPTGPLAQPIPCPAFYLLLLRRATGSQQMEAPGRTGAEHAELDGLSLSREEIGTDHLITVAAISVFSLPPGMPTIPSHFSQIVISRTQQLTQSDALRKKRAATKGFISGISSYPPLICSRQIPHVSPRLSNFLLYGHKICWNRGKTE